MQKFISKLISLFSRETVRSIALQKVFVKQSFQNFIFKHSYSSAPFQFKRKFIINLKYFVRRKCLQGTEI